MSNLINLTFETSNPIRIIDQNGDFWFVANDVCKILEHSNPSEALKSLDDDEKAKIDTTSSPKLNLALDNRVKEINIINESGLYALILRSRKAMQKGTVQHKFRKWVTAEVLPTLRKTGSYHTPEPATPTPKPQSPKLSQSDYNVLRRVVRLISDSMHYQGGATTAIYARLRTLCEVDSISDIRYQHLNIIRNELCRIERCLRTYTRHRREVEINLIRGICLGNDDSVWEAIKAIEKDSSIYVHQLNDSIDTFITLKEFKKIGSMS